MHMVAETIGLTLPPDMVSASPARVILPAERETGWQPGGEFATAATGWLRAALRELLLEAEAVLIETQESATNVLAIWEQAVADRYREGQLTAAEVGKILNHGSRWETEDFLRRHHCYYEFSIGELEDW